MKRFVEKDLSPQLLRCKRCAMYTDHKITKHLTICKKCDLHLGRTDRDGNPL